MAVYFLVQGQIISIGEVPIAIDVNAVWRVIDELDIPDRLDCFNKVMMVGNHFVGKTQDKMQRARQKWQK